MQSNDPGQNSGKIERPVVGDNPGFKLSPSQYLDSGLLDSEIFSQEGNLLKIIPIHLDDATEAANHHYPGYGTAVRECVAAFMDKRFEVEIKMIDNGNPNNVAFILTAKNCDKNTYGIPNFNFLKDEPGIIGRETGKGKKTVTAEDAGLESDYNKSHNQVESFNNLVRVILMPGIEGSKPFNFFVQYSREAFEEALSHVSSAINYKNASYCHLFHEVLREHLRNDISDASPDFLGEKFTPEIDPAASHVKGNMVTISANTGPIPKTFNYQLASGDYFSPFPVILRIKDEE
jgi:hypothetical protein